jgi:hypothetical protein
MTRSHLFLVRHGETDWRMRGEGLVTIAASEVDWRKALTDVRVGRPRNTSARSAVTLSLHRQR